MTSTNQLLPDHPGEILRLVMNVRDLSADSLAEALVKLTTEQRRDLLEILKDRHGVRSTLATSQLPIEKWHAMIGDPTLADPILDRLAHNAYKINHKGESMRKQKKTLTTITPTEA